MKKFTLTLLTLGLMFSSPITLSFAQETTVSGNDVQTEVKTPLLKEFATIEEVIEIYEKTYPNTSITSIELDHENEVYYFKIEGQDKNNEYELRLKAKGLEILEQKDAKDDDYDESEHINLNQLLSLDEVAQIALKEVKSGEVVKIDLDREEDHDETYYEIFIKDGKKEYEVRVDAYKGDILEVELDD